MATIAHLLRAPVHRREFWRWMLGRIPFGLWGQQLDPEIAQYPAV